jgi:hypothetical protein
MARPDEPPRARRGRPCSQTRREMLMPCPQYEALEQRQQAQHDQGKDYDESTIQDEDKDEDSDHASRVVVALLEARIRMTTTDLFKQVHLFNQGAAKSLYNDQMVTTLDVLQDLTNDIIKELWRAIRKPEGDGPRHQISKLSVTHLKLFAFWARHMWQTSRGVDLKEDAGQEDYDLRFTATLARWNLLDGTDDARRGNWESRMAVKRVPLS